MKSRKNTGQTSPKVGKTSKPECMSRIKTKQAVIPKRHLEVEEAPNKQEQWMSSQATDSPYHSEAEPRVNTDLGSQQDSVLAKYVERFRNGQPQSREERRQMASVRQEKSPFWWTSTSSSPPISTTNRARQEDDHAPDVFDVDQHERSQSILSDISLSEFDDLEILQLQERAGRLLQADGDCSVYGDSPPVSSEGLGCTDSPLDTLDDTLQRLSTASLLRSAVRLESDTPTMPSGVNPARPEDDILFQWRLRRKMEQAGKQHSSFNAHSWQRPSLHQSSSNGPANTEQQRDKQPEPPQRPSHICAPHVETKDSFHPQISCVSSTFQQDSTAHVPSHMHLLCDILPCPIRSMQSSQQVEPPSQSLPCPRKASEKTHLKRTEEPARKRIPAASSAQSKPQETTSRQQNKTDKLKTQTAQGTKCGTKKTKANTKQRKTTRCEHAELQSSTNIQPAHHRLPKKAMSSSVQQQKERGQDFPREGRAGGNPLSPLHSALGQVVSEVLFPPEESPAPVSTAMSESALSAPPRTTTSSRDAQRSVEVVSQLLQEAEDSDEKEFEDDALLQVLRRQRRSLKEQISAVALMLEEFPDEQRTCV